jgi:hypothetical protein
MHSRAIFLFFSSANRFYIVFISTDLWDIKHHRHWQKAFEMIADCKFSMLPSTIPKLGTILGGNITLHGNNLTLACFHGINFRSKSWALFSLNEAFIVFATEAQKTQEGGKGHLYIINHCL